MATKIAKITPLSINAHIEEATHMAEYHICSEMSEE